MLRKMIVAIGMVAVVIAGCSNGSDSVAIVNEQPILKKEYNQALDYTKQIYASQGMEISEEMLPMIEEQVLNDMIDFTLLAQEMDKQDIVVSDAQVNTELEKIKQPYSDEQQFNDALAANSMTLDELKLELYNQLRLDKFLSSQDGDITVTDEEITEYYNEHVKPSEDAPPLEEIKEQIRTGIYREKLMPIEAELLEKIKADSTIEIL